MFFRVSVKICNIHSKISVLESLNKKTTKQVFSCVYCKIFKNTFFTEHRRWLPLHIAVSLVIKNRIFMSMILHILYIRIFIRECCKVISSPG